MAIGHRYSICKVLVALFWTTFEPCQNQVVPSLPQTLIPTIKIIAVKKDYSVTIQTQNFPANDTFDVLMNLYGTRGIDGAKTGTFYSGAGGEQTVTFLTPDNVRGQDRIAIRLESPSGYFSFNWFWNNDTD